MSTQPYNAGFYRKEIDLCLSSARRIAPMVVELLNPRSVIDIGCGSGVWLSVFRELGVSDILGVDGDYVDQSVMAIPRDRFVPFDLTHPYRNDRQFDLVMSLEVAEHLPPACADTFIDTLVSLGPAVLFSAAIPHQGGVHHVNEQWPDYWAGRFAARGYACVDWIRPRVWTHADVASYYAQNTLLYVRGDILARHSKLTLRQVESPLPLVHPARYLETIDTLRRTQDAGRALAEHIPPGETIVLADMEQLRTTVAGGYRALPFLERDGVYWGPPADDRQAIDELSRQRQRGAAFFVLAWPAFWFLDSYPRFFQELRRQSRLCVENDAVLLFDLR